MGLIDFKRRLHMIKAVGSLITPFKDKYDVKYQIFPTINLACKISINSWSNLRYCMMDFGLKYMNRIFIYSSTFLGMYTFYLAILLLSYFNIVTYKFSLVFNLIAIFDICVVLKIVLTMLYYGAVINE